MAEPRLYDYLYLSFFFCLICGDLPFLVTQKAGIIHIVENKWTRRWFMFNSLINVVLVITMAASTRDLLLFFRGRQVDSFSLIFIFTKLVMLLYVLQRFFRRYIILNSATGLWKEFMEFDKKWEMGKDMDLQKLILPSRLKVIVMQICNFTTNIMFCRSFEISFYDICWFEYITILFSYLLYVYHVLYILIAEMIGKLCQDLEASKRHLEIKKIAAQFGDIMMISRRINEYLSVYIFLTFSFVGVQMVAYIYSLYKYSQGNSLFVTASVVSFILSFVIVSIGWFVLLAENCLDKVKELKRTLYLVSLRSQDPLVLKEVKLFSLQLLHDDFKVSGSGFFEINYKLMLNYMSTTVMYVVLLVQTDEALSTIIGGFMRSL